MLKTLRKEKWDPLKVEVLQTELNTFNVSLLLLRFAMEHHTAKGKRHFNVL